MARPVVITGGGTGGHLFPMVAIADALRANGWPARDLLFVGSRRGQDREILRGDINVLLLPGRGLRRSLSPSALLINLRALVQLAGALVISFAVTIRRRPRCVVSVGGYASLTMSLAAIVTGVPLVLVELDAHASAAQRVVRPFAKKRCVAFPDNDFKAVRTGAPVRAEVLSIDRSLEGRARAKAAMTPPITTPCLVVMSGSLGARSINQAVSSLASTWRERDDLCIVHVTGRRDYQAILARAPHGVLDYRVIEFADMTQVWAVADVAVCRAGAATVAELSALGVPAVLVPLPSAPGDHQQANAEAVAAEGRAIVVADRDVESAQFVAAIDELLTRVAVAPPAVPTPGASAAQRIADVITEVVTS